MLYENLCGAYQCTHPNCRVDYGYCHCGCGEETNLVIKGSKSRGTYAEIPRRFIKKHNVRGRTAREEAKHQAGESYVRADGFRVLPLDPDSVFAGMAAEGSVWISEH